MTLTTEPPCVDVPDAGVIEEARTRQRRQRYGVSGALVAIIVGLVAYAAVGGGGAGRAPFSAASPRGAAASARPLLRSDYQFFVTPDLFPGDAALDVYVKTICNQDRSISSSVIPQPLSAIHKWFSRLTHYLHINDNGSSIVTVFN